LLVAYNSKYYFFLKEGGGSTIWENTNREQQHASEEHQQQRGPKVPLKSGNNKQRATTMGNSNEGRTISKEQQ
jgi:hypothetical protein